MTIAVGIKYPWGELNRLMPAGIDVSEAIILATDSRFSKRLADWYTPAAESGTKLVQLGSDCAAVYAGDCNIAERCLDELRYNLPKETNYISPRSQMIAQKTFRNVFKYQTAVRKLDPDEAPIYIFIGACNENGIAELYIFKYNTDFAPEPISIPEAVGFKETVGVFKGLFRSEIRKRVEDELALRNKYPQISMVSVTPLPILDAQVAMLVTGILSKIIEPDSHVTIGGDVQCAIITSAGVSFPNISYAPDGTDEGPGRTRVTANPDELITVTGMSGIFGSYSMGD